MYNMMAKKVILPLMFNYFHEKSGYIIIMLELVLYMGNYTEYLNKFFFK